MSGMKQWLSCLVCVAFIIATVIAVIAVIELHEDGRNGESLLFGVLSVALMSVAASLLNLTIKRNRLG
jgi:uncharacterized membrane protein YhaH (DUF805 family)